MSIANKSAVAGFAAALAVASFAFVSPASADRWNNSRDARVGAGAAAGFAAGAIVGAAASQQGYVAPRGVYVAPRAVAPRGRYVAPPHRGAHVAPLPRGGYAAPAPRVYYRPPAQRSNCGVRNVTAWDPVQRRNVTTQRTVCW